MLHVGGTVEDGVNGCEGIQFLSYIAVDYEDAGAEEFLERSLEIVEQHVLQTALGSLLVLTTHETRDGRCIAVDEFT